MNTDYPNKQFKSGFWRLGNALRRRKQNFDELSEIYRKDTHKIALPDIFQRPTRKNDVEQNIFKRITRKIPLPDIFERPTRKINVPDIFKRPTRKIGKQLNISQKKIQTCSVSLTRLPQIDLVNFLLKGFREKFHNSIDFRAFLLQIECNNRQHRTIASKFRSSVDQTSHRNETQTIVYSSQLLLNGPIPLIRSIYKNLYDQNKQFPVDDFTAGKCHYFLTRFHPDQYAGLTEKFTEYIYASQITGKLSAYILIPSIHWCHRIFTAHLLRKIIKVDGGLLRILNPDVPIIVNGVEITAINVPRYSFYPH